MAPQTAHDVSVSGGTEKYQYYVSMGYSYQEGFFKSGDLNYDKYNVRANIAAEVVKGLKLDASVAGVVDQQNKPQTESDWLIRNWWRQGSVYPAYADPEVPWRSVSSRPVTRCVTMRAGRPPGTPGRNSGMRAGTTHWSSCP